ncbi:MAG: hypothetical protein HRU20_17750 [Pseudomonadales bacterium]|nr:hypothetical protein [Pseudomonadales bacterium]
MVEGLVSYNTFKRHWVIPVTLGTLQSDIKIPQSHTKSVQKAQIQAAESSVDRQINTQTTAQGLNIISEPGRNKSMSRFACLLGFIFTAAGCFLFYFALQGELMLWLMAPMFFSIGSGIWAYGIFLAGRKLECKMIDGRVYIRRSLFGKSLYSREGPLTSADQLELKTTMSSQQGSVKTEYMAIYAQVRCADGIRKIKLVEGIEGLAAGEAMHRKLRFAIEPK